MPSPPSRSFRRSDSETGFVLLAVIFLSVILLLSLAIAAPKMARAIQRDKELETIHRGEQYKRAIKLYYEQVGSYPTSIDQLLQTNQVRFLRKRYTDPLTGKDDWKPVLFGQAHVRPLGFFGQPLSGIGVAGIGGGMSASMYAAAPTSSTDSSGLPVYNGGDSSGDNSGSGTPASPSGTASPAAASPGSSMGLSGGSSSVGFNSGSSGFGSSGGMFGSSPMGSSPTMGSNSMMGSSPASAMGSSSSSPGGGTSATTFGGGGPIVGFTLPVNKPSLIDYKQQARYNKWEFNYDPIEDQMMAVGSITGGGPPVSPAGTPGTSTTTPGMPGASTAPGASANPGAQTSSPGFSSPTSPDSSSSPAGSSPFSSSPQ